MPAHTTAPLLPEGATALEIPSDRPAYYDSFKAYGVPAAATAVRLVIPPSERAAPPECMSLYTASHATAVRVGVSVVTAPAGMFTSRPQSMSIYMPAPAPEMVYFAKCFAYAYITPATAPCRADPVAFIRRVFPTLALDLPQNFKLLPANHDADATVRFRTPDDREAAMRRQPFELDGATVRLVREGETSNCFPVEYNNMAHVALRDYPIEQRTEQDIEANCGRLETVHVVLQLVHPREIPRQVRIEYFDGSTSVVPVEIVRVWDRAHSYDADGQYVRLFQAPAAAAA